MVGKVNTNKIWNFLVQGIGTSCTRQSGQVLITNLNYEWIEIKKGEKIPEDAIYNGEDENEDDVWIGKSLHNEPGKIICKGQHEGRPIMDKLWCHGSWCSHNKGYVLIVYGEESVADRYLDKLKVVNSVSEFE